MVFVDKEFIARTQFVRDAEFAFLEYISFPLDVASVILGKLLVLPPSQICNALFAVLMEPQCQQGMI